MRDDLRHPMVTFGEWKRRAPVDLWNAYQDAYGAVMFGAYWNGMDVTGLSKDEALEYAADFLRKLSAWMNEEMT